MGLSHDEIAISVGIAAAITITIIFVIASITYLFRKNNGGPPPPPPPSDYCYIWDSYDPADKLLPSGILGVVGDRVPVGALFDDGVWRLGSTTADPADHMWGRIVVRDVLDAMFPKGRISFLRLRDHVAQSCPFRAMNTSDTQVLFGDIPVCYSAGYGAFASSTQSGCPLDSGAPYYPLADVKLKS